MQLKYFEFFRLLAQKKILRQTVYQITFLLGCRLFMGTIVGAKRAGIAFLLFAKMKWSGKNSLVKIGF